jgi:carboxypeptidase Taq
MDIEKAERRLYALWGEIRDLRSAEDLLMWDQETYMPAGGVEARATTLATLAGIKHQRLTDPELGEVLEVCAAAPQDSVLAAQVHSARHEVDRAVRVPEELERALAEAAARGSAAWQKARAAADFRLFEGELRRLVELKREEAAAIGPGGKAYDALLHRFEPGATAARLAPLFGELEEALKPLVQEVVASGVEVDESPARGRYTAQRQERFGRQLAAAIGFDFETGRLDGSTHPFCIGIDRRDVRMTWRCQTDDFRPALFGVLHESGHALYEQGLPAEWDRTPLAEAASYGVHESQSRLWENHVGRSRGFWRWAHPRYRKAFPGAPASEADTLWPLLHTVRPSLIRVEADETTYNLHIVARFEVEQALFDGRIEVEDLPAFWDDRHEELLGLRPADAAEGVLQDIHWSQGMFGYFPTYTLGTLMGAQLFAAAGRELGDLEAAFAEGEFRPLLDWLRDKVHRHGSRYQAPELVERATGRPLAAADLLAYLRGTAQEVYGVGG